MNGWKSWLSEWKHIGKNRKILIPFLAVMFIPLIYSGMFLWAFWNPYGSMDELPVAVVNMDEGAEFNGESLDIGEEFIHQLEDSGDFEYHNVSKEKGYAGLENKDYYMLVEIPTHFSSDATTIMGDQPKQPQLKYVPNEGFNFLSAQIGESAAEQMKAKLSSEMTDNYADAMFNQFNKLKDGLADASEKAGELNDGAADLQSASSKIKDKLATFTEKQLQLADGTQSLRNGAASLATGSSDLREGLSGLQDGFSSLKQGTVNAREGAEDLQAGLERSEQGAVQLNEGLGQLIERTSPLEHGAGELHQAASQLSGGASDVSSSAAQIAQSAEGLKTQLSPLLKDMPEEEKQALLAKVEAMQLGSEKLQNGAQSLAAGAGQLQKKTAPLSDQMSSVIHAQKQLKKGASELVSGQQDLYAGAARLSDGEEKLLGNMNTFSQRLGEAVTGSEQVAAGASEVNQGASRIFDGSNQLADGSRKLQQGAADLSDGSTSLASGTEEFQTNLGEASTKAGEVPSGEATSGMMAEPVDVEKNAVNHVPNYGTGFTPYFLSLGLFVGALLITIVYPVRESFGRPGNAFSWFVSKFGVLFVAGTVQAIIAASVILFGLQLEVPNVGYFYLFSVITSLTFMALVQVLVTWFGDPGRFIAILILILQLTTSAGTFPLELIPKPLQMFNPLLPMTYSVSGFKAIISEGNTSAMWQNTLILGGFTAACLIITACYFIWSFRKDRHSSIQEEAV
ncbi:YhgE/Pip family protein [Halobacillus litoralis]|uniref:ABC-2 type transporter transmembrane domain-containing protein n=1 Tax=Halobacillus litoralis TaxID=45668 RepID=A0A410MAL5_9BACI|nr:YhgE/Pip domain-containing protein [Halobacillus litoralis]QAS51759.1 hypothetical protein HLI_05690 [Halobacillus litoralis]